MINHIYKYLKLQFKYLFVINSMYNTKVICTYTTSDLFLEEENKLLTEDEKGFMRDVIYRQEFLNILGMDEYNEKEIDKSIHELYEKIKEHEFLKECMLKLAANWLSTDIEFGLIILFSYDFMNVTHICISEFLETGKISNQNISKLKNIVF
jgi:hypothetical protein